MKLGEWLGALLRDPSPVPAAGDVAAPSDFTSASCSVRAVVMVVERREHPAADAPGGLAVRHLLGRLRQRQTDRAQPVDTVMKQLFYRRASRIARAMRRLPS